MRVCKLLVLKEVVGAKGFEPSTSWSRTRRASQAALRPDRGDRAMSCGLVADYRITQGMVTKHGGLRGERISARKERREEGEWISAGGIFVPGILAMRILARKVLAWRVFAR